MTRSIATLSVGSSPSIPLLVLSVYKAAQMNIKIQQSEKWCKYHHHHLLFLSCLSIWYGWSLQTVLFLYSKREREKKREIFKLLHKIFICKEFLRIRGSLWSRMIQPTHTHLQKVFSINIGTKETKSDPKNVRGNRTYATKHPQELKISWIILIGPNFSHWWLWC